MNAIQFTSDCSSQQEAQQAQAALKTMQGYLGGRILPPEAEQNASFVVQAFFARPSDLTAATPLPDGCRLVVIPDSQKTILGIA